MPNANGNGFPSMSDLLWFKSMGALTPDQVKMYYNGNAINIQQAIELGYNPNPQPQASNVVNTQKKATPVKSASSAPSSNANPAVNPQVNPNTNTAK